MKANENVVITEDVETELERCKKSPYYFAINYLKIKNAKGEMVNFETHLSEAEFNNIYNNIIKRK